MLQLYLSMKIPNLSFAMDQSAYGIIKPNCHSANTACDIRCSWLMQKNTLYIADG